MLIKASEIKVGDKLVSHRTSKPIVVEDVLVKEDGTVELQLEGTTPEYFIASTVVLVHRPE